MLATALSRTNFIIEYLQAGFSDYLTEDQKLFILKMAQKKPPMGGFVSPKSYT